MGKTKATILFYGGPLFGGFAHFEKGMVSKTHSSSFKLNATSTKK